MARYFHSGRAAEEVKEVGGMIYGGMERGNDPDRPAILKTPPRFGHGEVPLKKGGIAFGFVGHGFWHIGPGEYVDIPDEIPSRAVKNMAPQLFTKEEAMAAGLCHEDGSPVRKDETKLPQKK